MLRRTLALCALLLATMPGIAPSSPSLPADYQRPESYRHAINAVIGDLSFIDRYGTMPPAGTDADLRVRTHLEFVHALLSTADVSHLSDELRAARREHLARLAAYIVEGCFPRNYDYLDQNRPCFIDRDGRICAVGYLVEQSAGRELAERINAEYQYEFVWRMRMPELERWVAKSGFSLREVCMIQPAYLPRFNVTVKQNSAASPATVTVSGYVADDGFCGIGHAGFDLGDGTMWMSPVTNSYVIPVNFQHTYQARGVYVITGKAIGAYDCSDLVGTRTWIIALDGEPALPLTAVRIPGGPPYRVYLTTPRELRLYCLMAATVQWDEWSDPTPAGWTFDGSVYRTATHDYAYKGSKTIVVSNIYQAACGPNEAGSVTLNITTSTVGTEVSTWGKVKALYR